MNYNQAIQYLYNLTSLGWKLGLNKIHSLLKELENPHTKYRTIHIAGTNGKGSTSAMMESILTSAGYKTGLFTSPHLVNISERIRCNGEEINKDDLVKYIERIQPLIKKYKCTFFEAITAIALLYFADQKVDVAVIEVGLGGRLDATNVINPLISIITNISIDHTKQLGKNRKQIALEKAGIIKPDSVCITNSRYKNVTEVFNSICKDLDVEHINIADLLKTKNIHAGENFTSLDMSINGSVYPQLKLSLLGEHQIQNAALSVAAANIINAKFFPIKIEDIYHGLLDVKWPGRLQTISYNPKIVIDVAHNPNGISFLIKSIRTIFKYERLIVVFGVCKDKKYETMVKNIASVADIFIAVKANTHRSLPVSSLYKVARKYSDNIEKSNSIINGLNLAINRSTKKDLILCAGSHFLISEILQYYNK